MDLLSSLTGWNTGRAGPLHARLAGALRVAIERGEVVPGFRLPPERQLAHTLGISRTTVVTAYDALRDEDLLESRQGSGTWVRETPDLESARLAARSPGGLERHLLPRALGGGLAAIDFLGACLPALPGTLEEALALANRDLARLSTTTGYAPLGLDRLREAIAARFGAGGLETRPEQVLVTNGAQQAISLLASLLLRRGDRVVLEDPTYPGAIDAFAATGATLVPAPLGADGVDVGALTDLCARVRPRLVYVMPTFQNPTGAVMKPPERLALGRLAQRTGTVVVEDNTLADLALEAAPPPPVASLLPDAPIVTIGSMSKLFWGGLRVGWLRAPDALLRRLGSLKVAHDLGGSMLSQAAAVRLLERFDEVRAARIDEARRRLAALLSLLAEHLPTWRYRRPAGGLSLWVRLPHGDAEGLAEVAQRHGVSVVPGPVTSPTGGFSDHLRLVFVQDEDALREGVERLARAFRAARPQAAQPLGVIV